MGSLTEGAIKCNSEVEEKIRFKKSYFNPKFPISKQKDFEKKKREKMKKKKSSKNRITKSIPTN